MKKALVFAGGGSKGAYQYGAWKALREEGESFDLAVGTSIGSINAGFSVQDDGEAAGEMWHELNPDSVMTNGMNFEKSLAALYEQRESIAPFLKTYFKDGAGADITPFLNCLKKYANEEKFFHSPVDYALLTVKSQGMQPLEILKKDIKPGYFVQWLNASCACFPAFPRCEIDGQMYVDGGYYDNLPILTALRMGSDDITAIDLRPEGNHPAYMHHPQVRYLKPSKDLGSFLCFDRQVLDSLIQLGYHDTLRFFGRVKGLNYFFDNSADQQSRRAPAARRFLRQINAAELMYESNRRSVLSRAARSAPFIKSLLPHLSGEGEDALFLAACELALSRTGAPDDKIYTFDSVRENLLTYYQEIRETVFFDLTAAAEAIEKRNEEKSRSLLSELKRNDPETEDYLIALLTRVLWDE